MDNRGKTKTAAAALVGLCFTMLPGAGVARAEPVVAGVCDLTLTTAGAQALVPSTTTELPPLVSWNVGGDGPCTIATDNGLPSMNGSLELELTAVVGTGCLTAVAVGSGEFTLPRSGFSGGVDLLVGAASAGLLTVAGVGPDDRVAGAGVFVPHEGPAAACAPPSSASTAMSWTGTFVFGKVDPPLLGL